MPIYEFRCPSCGGRLEERRSPTDSSAPPPHCPDCRAPTKRVLSVFATAGRVGGTAVSEGGCGPGCACAARG